jgi:hypothetical protein
MFVSKLVGTLMRVEEDPITRYHYEIWFDYTRKAINTIGEGAMLAVPNFAGNTNETRYSILEVTGVLPIHYALGNDTNGYPGFVVEAARNAGQDWESQAETSTEDTTKIRCVAIPTNLEILEKVRNERSGKSVAQLDGKPLIQAEGNMPMVGHQVYLLDTATTEQVANLSIDLQHDNVIQIGTLVRDPNVHVYLRVEELINVHFGIFGFTGAGKSNLLSTLVRKLLTESKEPIKIVFFDLMSEYTSLLMDQLLELKGGRIVNIGGQSAPESVLEYYRTRDTENWKKATIDFINTSVLPKAIKRREKDLYRPMSKFLKEGKMLFWQKDQGTVGDVIEKAEDSFKKGMGGCEDDVFAYTRELSNQYSKDFSSNIIAAEIETKIDLFIRQYNEDENNKKAKKSITATARANLKSIIKTVKEAASQPVMEIPSGVKTSATQIIKMLNDPTESSLLVIQAHDPEELRQFAADLVNRLYESRRKDSSIAHLVSFIFDEADEFIPGQPTSDTQKYSKAAAMTLARRGRKFGLGLGIATQRIRYLDTSILAQPHTYFVSKLPRLSDRQAIAEAFGISEDMFRQTFKFKKGDWLLASYDAAGLEAIPIPIHTEDANDKIIEFVEKQKSAVH